MTGATTDVGGGRTTLLSPVLDLSGVAEPWVGYWRWFSNNTGSSPGNDVLTVDISNDGGSTWATVIANTPNDGSEALLLSCAMLTTTARIRIQAVGNIFFDVSDADFTIADVTPPTVTASSMRRTWR